jgi:hypothetical protein
MINRVGTMCVAAMSLCMIVLIVIHPLARDVKDTLLTRKRQLTADSDSDSLLGVLLLLCHKAK